MSDPLSISASVAGLVAISAKIASLAKQLYSSGRDAPLSISRIQAEMEQLHLIFVQIQMLLDGRAKKRPSRSRLSMLPLHHLMTILSGCILAYSSLHKKLSEVAGLAPDSAQSHDNSKSADVGALLMRRVKWILWKEAEAGVMLADLERHKSSLHMMLTIIQCNSATEAEESLERLHELVEKISQKISQSNQETATQLRELISEHLNHSSMSSPHLDNDTFNDNASIRTTATSFSIISVRSGIPSFVEELKNTRPYKRVLRRGIDNSSWSVFSKDSQATKGDTWSMLSDMSLGDLSISEISVLELPIFISDLYDPMPYQHSSNKKQGRQLFKFSSRGRLHGAIQNHNPFIFRTYLALGADPEETDADGDPPLVFAMRYGWSRPHIFVQLLLDRGAIVDSAGSSGRTPLSYAAGSGHLEICTLLLDSGANVDSNSKRGLTPLSYAAEHGKSEICKLLLDRGAIIDSADFNGLTALVYATEGGYFPTCELLLDRGATIDSPDSNRPTPLSFAAKRGKLEICTLLLDRGAVIDSTDSNGRTPLSHAAERKHSKICKLLLDRGAQELSDAYTVVPFYAET